MIATSSRQIPLLPLAKGHITGPAKPDPGPSDRAKPATRFRSHVRPATAFLWPVVDADGAPFHAVPPNEKGPRNARPFD